MGETVYNLAFDFGASSGRMVLCKLEDGKLTLEELHRFPNVEIRVGGHIYYRSPIGVCNVKILVHRIDNNNLIFSTKKDLSQFHFTEMGLTTTRHTEHESVTINQLFTISNIDIPRYLIDAIITTTTIV